MKLGEGQSVLRKRLYMRCACSSRQLRREGARVEITSGEAEDAQR